MPFHELCEDPARLFVVGPFLSVYWHTFGKPLHDGQIPQAFLAACFADIRAGRRRALYRFAILQKARPQCLQPVAQPECRNTIVTVVGGDDLPDLSRDALRFS